VGKTLANLNSSDPLDGLGWIEEHAERTRQANTMTAKKRLDTEFMKREMMQGGKCLGKMAKEKSSTLLS
jgi:hypothetical protein